MAQLDELLDLRRVLGRVRGEERGVRGRRLRTQHGGAHVVDRRERVGQGHVLHPGAGGLEPRVTASRCLPISGVARARNDASTPRRGAGGAITAPT